MRGESRRAMTAIGVFLFFGAIMAFLAGATLICQGTLLDHMWTLNAPAYKQLSPLEKQWAFLFWCSAPAWRLRAAVGLDADFGDGGSSWSSSQPRSWET